MVINEDGNVENQISDFDLIGKLEKRIVRLESKIKDWQDTLSILAKVYSKIKEKNK